MNDWFSELTDDEASSMELLKVVLDGLGMSSFSSPVEMDKVNPVEYISPVALQSGMNGKEGSKKAQGGRSESPETVASFALRSNGGPGRGSPLSLSQSTSASPSAGSVNQYTFPTGSTVYSVLDSSSANGFASESGTSSGSGTYDSSTMDDLSTMFDIDMSSLDPLHQNRQSQSKSQSMARYQEVNGNGMSGQGERSMEAEGWMMGVLPFDMVDQGMVIA
jgi:hypothetical protein